MTHSQQEANDVQSSSAKESGIHSSLIKHIVDTMRQHSRRSWTAPAKHKPRDPPKGDVNAIPWVPKAARPLVLLSELTLNGHG